VVGSAVQMFGSSVGRTEGLVENAFTAGGWLEQFANTRKRILPEKQLLDCYEKLSRILCNEVLSHWPYRSCAITLFSVNSPTRIHGAATPPKKPTRCTWTGGSFHI